MKPITALPSFCDPIFLYQVDVDNVSILNFLKNIEYTSINGDEVIDTYISKNLQLFKNLPDLELEINKCFAHVINEILMFDSKFRICNSWASKCPPEGFSASHIHTNTWLTGVYYPMGNPGHQIRLYNDKRPLFQDRDPREYNVFNSHAYTFQAKTNNVLIFHSTMRHKILRNTSDIDRYSIAFNIIPKGDFGDNDYRINFGE
jgi:uncharacterized protein (TIGR02466 family)